MKISKVSVNHFGKLNNKTLTFGDKINVVSGNNESGKSTLHTFTESMLFGLERGKGRNAKLDDYNHFMPWDGGTFGGAIEIENGDTTYMISRNFSKDNPSLVIRNQTESKNVEATSQNYSEILCGLTKPLYKNTISVGQLSVNTGEDLSSALRSHIINLQSTGAFNINVSSAVKSLEAEKKRLERGFSKAAVTEAEGLNSRISALENSLSSNDSIIKLREASSNKKACEAKIDSLIVESDKIKQLLTRSSNVISRHRVLTKEDAASLANETDTVCNKLDKYLSRHKINILKGAKPFYVIFLIIFILSLVACTFLGLGQYVRKGLDLIALAPYAAGVGISLLFIILNIVNLASIGHYHTLLEDFNDLHREFYGSVCGKVDKDKIAEVKSHPHNLLILLDSIDENKKAVEEFDSNIAKEREKLIDLSAKLDLAKKDAWLYEQKEEELANLGTELESHREQLEKNVYIKEEAEAIDLAIGTIKELSTGIFDSFGHFLENRISSILSDMTNGAYGNVEIDEDLNVTLFAGERRVSLSSVSTGTLDQVYLALRLALVDLFWPDEDMPLLLDDSFAMYDKMRLENTLKYLSSYYPGQIIIFSCHTREAEILRDLGLPYNMISMN